VHKSAQQAGELHREDVLRGWTGRHDLERVEVLQGNRLLVDLLGNRIDFVEGGGIAFGA